METKPVFCSECGTKLTGSAAFCSKCGAKQQSAPVPVAEVVPDPVVEAVPEVVPVTAPDPVPEVKPAPAPVSAPANALPRKAKLSAFGLIIAVLALGTAVLAFILQIVSYVLMYREALEHVGMSLLTSNLPGMLAAFIVPLAVLVVVFVKNKPLAIIGLILAVLSLGFQFIFAIVTLITTTQGMHQAILNFLMRPVNGKFLFIDLWQIINRTVNGHLNAQSMAWLLPRLFASLLFFAKNLLAVFACLAVVVKRKK